MGYKFNPFTGNFDLVDGGGLTEWEESDVSYFAGAVTGARFAPVGVTNPVNLEALDLSGLGQPNALGFTVNGEDGSLYFIDTSTLTPYWSLKYIADTPADRNFIVGLAEGTSSNQELVITPAGVSGTIIKDEDDMASNSDDHLATQQSIKAYTDAKVSDTAYGSGWNGVTGIAPSKNAVYDKIESMGAGTPGGSDTQVQYNDGGSFGGDSGLTFNETTNILTATGGMRVTSGNSFGDDGGNGNIIFNENTAKIYGYTYVNFYDGSSSNPYFQATRARWDYNPANALDFSAISAGQGDNSVGLMPTNISAYQGVGAGVYISGGVTATANNDFMVGTYFRARFTPGAFTGLTRTGVIFDVPDSNSEIVRFITRASNDDIVEIVRQAKTTTTNNTQATLATITIPTTTTVQIEASVVARRTGGSAGAAEDGAGYRIIATVKNVAGTATLIGAVSAPHTAEDQAGWDATIDVTGATARIRVTGATNNNISWVTTYRVQLIGT